MKNPITYLKSLYVRSKKNRSPQWLARWNRAHAAMWQAFAKMPMGPQAFRWLEKHQGKLMALFAARMKPSSDVDKKLVVPVRHPETNKESDAPKAKEYSFKNLNRVY